MSAPGDARLSSILLVEEDEEQRAAITGLLSQCLPATRLLTAANGDEAWDACRHGGVDVLVCEAATPGLDGIALARRVRNDPGSAATYIILVAGLAPAGDLLGAINECADYCLLKPLRGGELAVRIKAGLRHIEDLRRLHARARELEQLYARQSDFLSVVSHEIRTPLSAILSSANILMRYGAQRPDSVERFARVIHQEGQRLTRLINNLLDLAKIEAGLVDWRITEVAVSGLFNGVRESFAALAGERKLRLELDNGPGVSEIRADGDKLTQVLLNLVSNAVKHSSDGSTVWVRSRVATGGGVRFEVEDEGAGIPPGMEERVFERFAQLESRDERGGTGLGLTICRQIVEHHGGRIWAAPDRSSGALFVAELPRRAAIGATDGPV